jgi:hypothetical protein
MRHACQRPRDEANAEFLASDMRQLLPKFWLASQDSSVTTTDDPKASRPRYGGRQSPTSHKGHGSA